MKKLLIIVAAVFLLAFTVRALAQTLPLPAQSITIGKLTYVGTDTETWYGQVIQVSYYEVAFATAGVTAQPISFSKAIAFVKGTTWNFLQNFTTGDGCGLESGTPCDETLLGGPGSLNFHLAPCAAGVALRQNCISIALQLLSATGKNFNITLANGAQFCAYAINNTFLLPKLDQAALDPQCNAEGFCKTASAKIILRAAPATSCN